MKSEMSEVHSIRNIFGKKKVATEIKQTEYTKTQYSSPFIHRMQE